MKANLISIGDEVLLGDTIDTNAAWIARSLADSSITVQKQTTIGDNEKQILQEVEEALNEADLVILTGGLGPTNDDKTKEVLAHYFQTPLVVNPQLEEKVRHYYTSRGRSASEVTKKMILMPQDAHMIPNDFGVAPAMWFERENKILIALPGVPFEMKGIMTNEILPKLATLQNGHFLVYRYFITAGLGETVLAHRLEQIENSLPDNFTLSYLPSFYSVKIRLSGHGSNKAQLNEQADHLANAIRPHLEDVLFSEEVNGNLVDSVAALMNLNQWTLSTAESCTGGNIAHQITLKSGSSSYFIGGVVAYSNQVKMDVLAVKEEILDTFGAVSEQTVVEMVKGSLKQFGTDYAIAVSGIAGPTGGSPEKPVGTVCIAVGNSDKIEAKTFKFAKQREKNIDLSTMVALNMLYRQLINRKHS